MTHCVGTAKYPFATSLGGSSCRTLKSGSNQISEQPKSFSSCGRLSAERPRLSFERIAEGRLLSRIQTTDEVYNTPVFHSLIVDSAEKTRDNGSASGSSGSNYIVTLDSPGGSSGTSAHIVPLRSSTHFTSPGQVTAIAKKKKPNLRIHRNFSWFR